MLLVPGERRRGARAPGGGRGAARRASSCARRSRSPARTCAPRSTRPALSRWGAAPAGARARRGLGRRGRPVARGHRRARRLVRAEVERLARRHRGAARRRRDARLSRSRRARCTPASIAPAAIWRCSRSSPASSSASSSPAPRLRALGERLRHGDEPASHQIARLARLVDWANAQRNQFFAPIGWLVLWPVHFAYAIEGWRARSGADVARWIDVIGEIEALCAARRLRLRAPRRAVPRDRRRRRRASRPMALGHPLIPRRKCVRNDVALGGALRLLRRVGLEHVGQVDDAAHASASTSCWRWPARRCARDGCAVAAAGRRHPAHPGLARRGRLALLRRDHAAQAARRSVARRSRRCCSCSTRSSPAPTRTIAASAPRRSCAAWSSTAPSAWSPRTTWRWPRSPCRKDPCTAQGLRQAAAPGWCGASASSATAAIGCQ